MTSNARSLMSLGGRWSMIIPRGPLRATLRGEVISCRPSPEVPADLGAPSRYDLQEVTVPTVWEREGVAKSYTGPVWFRKGFTGPSRPSEGERLLLRFSGVSAVATAWLNGEKIGTTHRGIWDAFELDVTSSLACGGDNLLLVEVLKPGGAYPVSGSLAGFVPYVTTTFGGIWQSVDLMAAPRDRIEDLWAAPCVDRGVLEVRGRAVLAAPAGAAALEAAVGGRNYSFALQPRNGARPFRFEVPAGGLGEWSPERPALHTLTARLRRGGAAGPAAEVRFGMREPAPAGALVRLNGRPRYLRGVLHWCAYTDTISPTPERGRIENELGRMRELGYNLVKLCLVIPWDLYFDVADEMGMMLWVELPLWLPRMDEGFRRRAHREYTAIARRLRNHPSVVVWTLGCELDRSVDAATLRSLYDTVRRESGSSLVRDNSGSPECYGGVEQEFADFHDYHFYAEAHHFADLMDNFSPHWKERKPLLFGEYCDCDTFRSIASDYPDGEPWWSRADSIDNPKGVRWDYNITTNRERIAACPPPASDAQMRRRSFAKALEYRQDILEQTRRRADTAGYVVTNIQDTPLSTSGMMDDQGRLKFDPAAFRRFNADTVLSAEVERRRVWENGGDRPQYLDELCVSSPGRLRRRIVVSHFGTSTGPAELHWELRRGEELLGNGAFDGLVLESGRVFLAGTVDVEIPGGERAEEARLLATLTDRRGPIAEGLWHYWLLPDRPALERSVALWDPGGSLEGIERVTSPVRRVDSPEEAAAESVVVATAIHRALRNVLDRGASLLLALGGARASCIEPCPFFREAVPVILPGGPLDELPHGGYGGIHWKGVAPDRALRRPALEELLGVAMHDEMARWDARTFVTASYLSATRGRTAGAVATTLRLSGGRGRQPGGLERNVLGRAILRLLLEHLGRGA